MKELLERSRKEFTDKTAQRDALLAKEEMSAEDLAQVRTLNTDLITLKDKILDLQKTAKEVEDTRAFANDPVLNLPISGAARVEGYVETRNQAVEMGWDNKRGVVAENFGEDGLMSPDLLRKISTREYADAFTKHIRYRGDLGMLDSIERRTLSEGSDTAGGFFVPDTWLRQLIAKEPAPTRLNGRVTQFNIGTDSVVIPRVVYTTDDIYTTGIRVTLTGETPTSSTVHRVTDPVFGTVRFNIGTYMMSLPLTNDLVEDSYFPIQSWCVSKFQETIDLLYDDQLINGTGVGARPHGMIINPGGSNDPGSVVSGTANNIDADQLRKIPYQLPEQYISANTAWLMNRSSTGSYISTMKDSQNRYLFALGSQYPGIVERMPDTIDGFPIIYSAFMPDNGTSTNYPVAFGDFRGLAKVNRVGFSVRVLTEINAQDNYVVLLGRLRWGGGVYEPFRIKLGKSHSS